MAPALHLTPVLGKYADQHCEILTPVELAALFLPTFLHEQAVRRLSPFDRDPYVKIDAWKAVRRITSLVLNPCDGPWLEADGAVTI